MLKPDVTKDIKPEGCAFSLFEGVKQQYVPCVNEVVGMIVIAATKTEVPVCAWHKAMLNKGGLPNV